MAKTKLLRVTQMNAIYLDKEIERSFQQIIQDAIKHLPPGLISPVSAEIDLLIRLGIAKYSLLENGSTFGQRLFNIKYDNLTNVKKTLYILFGSLGYFQGKCELWKPSHAIARLIFKIGVVIKVLDFLNTSLFLRYGVKPLLVERLLGLNQVFATETPARNFESKYLARELLWNGFIEILVYMIPLINYHRLKRQIKEYNPFSRKKASTVTVIKNPQITLNTKCGHCGQSPILPHHMGCAHIYCYVCLKGNQTADPKYQCSICEHSNANILCDPVNA
ncbi:peroxisome biogenesis factor 2 [Dendroctonus ponderosae]|uniref:RING-type E3 ubiquitin transferase (cysteine targeting) n=1 Tax=Dendroctonus ponderosae TaxID=77166 RepID=J3JVV7_DENPD